MAEPTRVADDDLTRIDAALEPNEASGLCAIESRGLLERLGWSEGYWTVLDDGPVERCVAAIGRRAGAGDDGARDEPTDELEQRAWLVRRLVPPEPAEGWPATDDGEAIAARDGVVHVFGSLYGGKDGPLEAERQFLARFREDDVRLLTDVPEDAPAAGDDLADDDGGNDPVTATMEVVADDFRLHRAINDALRDSGLPLLDPGPKVRKATVGRARRKAIKHDRDWSWRLRWDDHPINVEGAAFLPSGACVLGLRVPVHADGHPLVVVVEGIERAFGSTDGQPRVVSVHVVANIGEPAAPVGVRDLAVRGGDSLHLLAGNLDSTGKGSVFLDHNPEGARAASSQWHVDLVDGDLPSRDLGGVPDRHFPDLRRVEGLAFAPDGTPRYVVDEDEAVGLRVE